ncbi:MAG: hypothetical protein MI724_13280, partial [Spirochaetales bacterium]|nr:hypothetical protein [Spirochaetales bacterium]
MKVINASDHLPRPRMVLPGNGSPIADTLRGRAIRIVNVLVGALALAACSAGGVDWSDYEGVDLISTRSRDASQWYFAPGLDTDTDATATFDYVEFEEVSSDIYGALPEGVDGPVYRLEVVNLFRDGTFEQDSAADDTAPADLGTLGWVDGDTDTTDGPDSARPTIAVTTPNAGINGQSLRLNFDNNRVYYAVNLSTALSDGFPASSLYAFHLDFRSNSQQFGIELHDNGSAGSDQITQLISRSTNSQTTVFAYPGSAGENGDIVDAIAAGDNSVTPESGFS